ncbi:MULTISPECIES: hypothetical protein [unclassified Saccharopolyspora]|uniref:hypothetical protein n=1 Tax=unclassified Saccharopolyspora TaxID=2646250 RepID=UPI001CD22F58|nr:MULTISPECIES: hypothetical protein [unclassified Saccharopolyspora]MCA1186485.1 hypothetical protein [Saccharopolyspora sp. 6T]MCA1282183.1 hypothetical protein [Saccharopolyspora sp. 7B]
MGSTRRTGSSIVVVAGRGYLVQGGLNTTIAGQARRVLVVFFAGTLVTGGFAAFDLVMITGTSPDVGGTSGEFTAGLVGYLLLPLVLVVLSAVHVAVGRRWFRPSPALLRKHSATGRRGPGR